MTFDDGISLLPDIRFRSNGSRVSDQEIIEQYGSLALRLVRLQEALDRRALEPITLSYPPQIFVAYKWGSKENRVWVERLAEAIRLRGYDPILDSYRNDDEDLNAEEFISKICNCSAMVIAVTRDYLEFVGKAQTSWVFDELQLACSIQEYQDLKIIPLLRERELDVGLLPLIGGRERMVEMWEDDVFSQQLDKIFLRYDGPCLSFEERREVLSQFSEAKAKIDGEDHKSALQIMRSILVRFPFIRDIWIHQIALLVEDGLYRDALSVAEEAGMHILPSDQPFKVEIWRSKLLNELGYSKSAVKAAITVIKATKNQIENFEAHRLIGNVLDDAGDHLGGRNHLMKAWNGSQDPIIGNDLAVAYMRMGCWDKAKDMLNVVLETHPEFGLAIGNQRQLDKALKDYSSKQKLYIDELKELVPVPWIECESCKSLFAIDGRKIVLCGDCGGAYHRELLYDCPYCGNDGIVPISLLTMDRLPVGSAVMCPTCKAGKLKLAEKLDIGSHRTTTLPREACHWWQFWK